MSLSKNTIKIISTCLQLVVLLAAIAFAARQFMERSDPPVFDRDNWTQRDGFTAISYTSLTREERSGQNSREQFARHIEALKSAGYHWITTKDIINFYENNKPLPEKPLYLMLEGGRKDNVIFGQDVIAPAGACASIFTYTATLSGWNNFFITYSNLASLSKSPFWDAGSQGYNLLRINENMPGVDPGYFSSDFLRDASGKRTETDNQLFERLADFYEKSYEPLNKHMLSPPLAFIFMPANTLGPYMPPELEAANKTLMERYFKTAFTREGTSFNSAADTVFNLSRMQVKPYWGAEDLLHAIQKWSFRRKKFEISSTDSAEVWNAFRTSVAVADTDLILLPEAGFIDPAVLGGSSAWDNVNLSVTFRKRDSGERYIYLRYASKESYLRLTLKANRLSAHERLPGKGLISIYDSVLPEREPWKFDVQLKGNRLRIHLNGSQLAMLPVSKLVRRGSVALGASPAPDYQAVFTDVTAEHLPTVWQYAEHGGDAPPEPDSPGVITARVLPLPQDSFMMADVAHQLLQTGGEGNMAVAALPKGKLDFAPEDLDIPPFDREYSSRLWGGLLIQPGPDADWALVKRTVESITGSYYAVVRLSLETALSLTASGHSLDADYLLLDFAQKDMPHKDWTALAHRHNRNNFLYVQPGGRSNIYSTESR